jgi:hypothetical protein
MKKLLVLLIAACFCLVPTMALAGNTSPTLYLEIYMLDYDPDDPGPPPANLCVHPSRPLVGELPCFSPKAPYNFGIVPIHIGKLDTDPAKGGVLAPGWPLPCGPGGGYDVISVGVAKTGTAVTYVGITGCPGFLQGPGTPPAAILFAATTACHDWLDHPCYVKYMSTTAMTATFFTIVANTDDGLIQLINCQLGQEIPAVGGGAQWGGTKSIVCGLDPTAVDLTTWGNIKGLYR